MEMCLAHLPGSEVDSDTIFFVHSSSEKVIQLWNLASTGIRSFCAFGDYKKN